MPVVFGGKPKYYTDWPDVGARCTVSGSQNDHLTPLVNPRWQVATSWHYYCCVWVFIKCVNKMIEVRQGHQCGLQSVSVQDCNFNCKI